MSNSIRKDPKQLLPRNCQQLRGNFPDGYNFKYVCIWGFEQQDCSPCADSLLFLSEKFGVHHASKSKFLMVFPHIVHVYGKLLPLVWPSGTAQRTAEGFVL